MFVFKIDEEVELKLLEERDARALFELADRNREHLGKWLTWVDGTESADDTLAFIRRARKAHAENRMIPTSIWHRGQVAGTLGLQDLNWSVGSGEIGYWLGAEYEGKGIMTRACRGLISRAFLELGLNRIVIQCGTENTRSRAIPERLGFTHEGTRRQSSMLNGERIDMELYSVLRREWE